MTRGHADIYRHARRVIVLAPCFWPRSPAASRAAPPSRRACSAPRRQRPRHRRTHLYDVRHPLAGADHGLVTSCLRHRSLSQTTRARGQPDAGNMSIEVLWTVIPAIIVAVLFALTMQTTGKLIDPAGRRRPHGHRPPVVVAGQVRRRRLLHRQRDPPAGRYHDQRPTCCPPTSSTSFWVRSSPARCRSSRHVNHVSFLPVRAGTYLGVCAQFCGAEHAHMHFLVDRAVRRRSSTPWFDNQMKPAVKPTGAQAIAGAAAMPACRARAATPSAAPA